MRRIGAQLRREAASRGRLGDARRQRGQFVALKTNPDEARARRIRKDANAARRNLERRGRLRDRAERIRDRRQALARNRGAKKKQRQMEIRAPDPPDTVLSDIVLGPDIV